MTTEILGIRHHGPGSARSLLRKLEQMKPNIILIEGPPEAESILTFVSQEGMQPPIAILAYEPDSPQNAAFYPFTEFSPEWQAIRFGLNNHIPIRFIDLPLIHKMVREEKNQENIGEQSVVEEISDDPSVKDIEYDIDSDPINYMAKLAGYDDGELWWEHTFEQRLDTNEVFEAVMEMMTPFRESSSSGKSDINNLRREAYMRKCIKGAQKQGYERIAVVCGAFHAPALSEVTSVKSDAELLKNLNKVKINCTWIPWTNSRMTFASGYGAGIHSPGWYQHLWQNPEDTGSHWLSLVASTFRKNGMDVSSAHVIESVRLAEMLSILRDRPTPGLYEFNEAITTVMCFGESFPMGLINKELIVGNQIGSVVENVPQVPLYSDFEKIQKKLRLPAKDDEKEYSLDLREENDLNGSRFLHRLDILGIEWGRRKFVSGKGTFKELWGLRWEPEIALKVIEMGIWGNTVQEAATNFLVNKASEETSVSVLSSFLEKTIPSDLPSALDLLFKRLENCAALTHDIQELMKAFLPLATVSRYGNVRKTETGILQKLCEGFLVRICIGLPNACFSMDDESAEAMLENIKNVNEGVVLLSNDETNQQWQSALFVLNESITINGIIKGYITRLLNDSGGYTKEEISSFFAYALSIGNDRMYSASWLEGFLKGGGTILLLDDALWGLIDRWVSDIEKESFNEILPLLRRTFSTFSSSEKRQLGEKAIRGVNDYATVNSDQDSDIDHERGAQSLDIIKLLLGIKSN